MLSAAKETGSCPMAGLLETLARPWTMHILWALSTGGPTRFGVLRRKIGGISSRVLAVRLRSLEAKGFIFRRYKATIPPEVTYGLTARMRDIQKVLNELNRMSVKWKHRDSIGSRAGATKNGRRGAMRAA
jgi:DNA-binding HxlR family transcriptional regulator